jgi:hypothetical protein
LSRSKNHETFLIHPPLYYLYFGGFNLVFFVFAYPVLQILLGILKYLTCLKAAACRASRTAGGGVSVKEGI